MSHTEKTYFTYKETETDYFWEWPNKERLRFCGNPKFIVQALINTYWPEEGKEVFDKFMNGIRGTTEIDIWDKPAATFVLYTRKYDLKKLWEFLDKTVHDTEKKLGEDGEDIGEEDLW